MLNNLLMMAPFTTTSLLTGFFFAAFGLWYYYYPPKHINSFSGYRTTSSMRNQQTWDAANRYSSRIMLIVGVVLLLLGLASVFITFLKELHVLIAIATTVVAALFILLCTERHLDKTFDAEGNKRN